MAILSATMLAYDDLKEEQIYRDALFFKSIIGSDSNRHYHNL